MHIAFLTPEYPSDRTGHSGGLGTSIRNLAQALVKVGVQVSIFVYGQDTDEHYTEAGIRYHRIKNVRVRGLSWWLTRRKIECLINDEIKKTGIDVVEVADWTGISAWMNFNCPVMMRLHGSDTYFCLLEKRHVKWWNKYQEKTAYQHADAIIAVSDFVGAISNQVFGTQRKYTVIPNSIDTSFFTPAKHKTDAPVILYFGTLIRKKGALNIPHIFNHVVEKIPHAQLILVGGDASDIKTGSPSTWALMQPLFSPTAIKNVEYVGKKPYSEIKAYIEQAQVCIFPSYAEALPVSWLEAMAMGKAIVASNIGWANEMLTHEKEALLCYPAEHEKYAAYIIQLLSDADLRIKLGDNAMQRVINQFDNSIVALKNIEYYTSLIDNYSKVR